MIIFATFDGTIDERLVDVDGFRGAPYCRSVVIKDNLWVEAGAKLSVLLNQLKKIFVR